ncbi:DUF481 domain-containing protein [Candidatus Colwellia aromaticivorans]|uniref:DUF481 domain-containing protein n=1 Tax=Candidatus Colwellia aromaticivorans TaxID=2267621 RepID=UPI000DF13988|nr:DUF481 domain-containing protein [Candidatus Colwellia aromaticivorans]
MKINLLKVFCCLFLSSFTAVATENVADWQKPNVQFKQDFDWLKLASDEWLKGDFVSMYDEELEFDSDELDMQTIDWEDVAELRSKSILSIRMIDGTIAEGYLVVKDGKLTLVQNGQATNYKMSELISIASSAKNELDLWDGYIKLGANFRRGNTVQFDYNLTAGVQRRSSSSRLKVDYTANYSRYEDQDTKIESVTADSARLTSTYDWFFSQRVFLRATDFEYFSDEFLNVDYRLSYGIGLGYHLIDNSRTSWDVNAGPSYQKTKFNNVAIDKESSESSPGLSLGTDFTYEITGEIDFDASYNVQFVSDESGEYLHHFETGIEIELASDFDLDITLYLDRTESPHADEFGNIPEKNDYRFVVSLGYDF